MGWANCGDDSRGRPIGYAVAATCDHPGCEASIHRGLSYACGGDHGSFCVTTNAGMAYTPCEDYFCSDHLKWSEPDDVPEMCPACVEHHVKHWAEEGLVFDDGTPTPTGKDQHRMGKV